MLFRDKKQANTGLANSASVVANTGLPLANMANKGVANSPPLCLPGVPIKTPDGHIRGARRSYMRDYMRRRRANQH